MSVFLTTCHGFLPDTVRTGRPGILHGQRAEPCWAQGTCPAVHAGGAVQGGGGDVPAIAGADAGPEACGRGHAAASQGRASGSPGNILQLLYRGVWWLLDCQELAERLLRLSSDLSDRLLEVGSEAPGWRYIDKMGVRIRECFWERSRQVARKCCFEGDTAKAARLHIRIVWMRTSCSLQR